MKRKSVGIAVVIAALAVLVNVFALKSATVNNGLSFRVENTTTALIAITGSGVDSDVTFSSTNGYAEISLPSTGFQPDSSYTYTPIFNVVNNSGASRTISLNSSSLPTGVTVSFVDSSGDPLTPGALANNASLAVGIKVTLTQAASASVGSNQTLTISVGAQ